MSVEALNYAQQSHSANPANNSPTYGLKFRAGVLRLTEVTPKPGEHAKRTLEPVGASKLGEVSVLKHVLGDVQARLQRLVVRGRPLENVPEEPGRF